MSASLVQGDAMTWAQRELVNAATSRLNQCLY
jgi:AhpD family alkylhydroperoxidase